MTTLPSELDAALRTLGVLPSLPPLSADAPEWVRQAVEDALGGPFPDPLRAAGLKLRFDESDAARQGWLDALLRGDDDPGWVPVRAWWYGLRGQERAERVEVAKTAAGDLLARLEALREDMAPTRAWSARFTRACLDRDEFESTRAALVAVDACLPLDAVLDTVDEAGSALLDALPFTPDVRDERLAAAGAWALGGWWRRWAR